MHLFRLLLIAAAFGALYYYLPPLLTMSPTPILACLVAVGYLGFVAGELLEFCVDRYNVAKRL